MLSFVSESLSIFFNLSPLFIYSSFYFIFLFCISRVYTLSILKLLILGFIALFYVVGHLYLNLMILFIYALSFYFLQFFFLFSHNFNLIFFNFFFTVSKLFNVFSTPSQVTILAGQSGNCLYSFQTILRSNIYAIFQRKLYSFIIVKNEKLLSSLFYLKNSATKLFQSLLDICVIDYPARTFRFELLYSFISVFTINRLFLKVNLSDVDSVSSLTSLYVNADWLERECWDLFGIFFFNHPNLRRLLTDYGFHGHPLRKDFPLTGYLEVRFDDERFNIVYEPLEITQEFRKYYFKNPWERSFA